MSRYGTLSIDLEHFLYVHASVKKWENNPPTYDELVDLVYTLLTRVIHMEVEETPDEQTIDPHNIRTPDRRLGH